MTNTEAKAKLQEIEEELKSKLQEQHKLFKSGELSKEKYDYGFLEYHNIKSDYLTDYNTLDGVMKMMQEFKEECEEYKNNIGFKILYIEPCSDYDSSSIDYNYFRCDFYKVKDEVKEHTINKQFRDFMKKELEPLNYTGYTRDIDCKIMKLFMEGTIDFKTLQQITYSDCNLE